MDMLEYLLNQGKIIERKLLDELNEEGYTPLGLAAFMGHIAAGLLLLRKQADPNFQNHQSETPLFFAVRGRQRNAIHMLAASGADLTFRREKKPCTPFELADTLAEEHQSKNAELWEEYRLIKNVLHNIAKAKGANKYKPPNFFQTKVKNLVFKGGGPKGIAYVGALRELESLKRDEVEEIESNFFEGIERVAGTSAGAITALLVAMNYSASEVETILQQTSLSSFIEGINVDRLRQANVSGVLWEWCKAAYRRGGSSFLSHFNPLKKMYEMDGLCSGDTFRDWAEGVIQAALVNAGITQPHLTFGELNKLIQQGKPFKHLYVVATKITNPPEIVVFNSEDKAWEHVIIADAIRASMSIPGIFSPYSVRAKITVNNRPQLTPLGDQYVDGGLLKNYPVDIFDKVKYQEQVLPEQGDFPLFNRQTLGFCLIASSEEEQKPATQPLVVTNLKELVVAVTQVYSQAEQLLADFTGSDSLRTVYVDNCGVSLLDFDMDKATQNRLMKAGQEAVRQSAFFRDFNTPLKSIQDEKKEDAPIQGKPASSETSPRLLSAPSAFFNNSSSSSTSHPSPSLSTGASISSSESQETMRTLAMGSNPGRSSITESKSKGPMTAVSIGGNIDERAQRAIAQGFFNASVFQPTAPQQSHTLLPNPASESSSSSYGLKKK
jgi:NTE family protein